MKKFYEQYRWPVAVILIFILAGGAYCYSKLQTSLFPEITFPKVKIIADNGEEPVSKMMVTVTKPLENAIKQIPDLENIRSITSRGSCEISAFLKGGANIDLAKQNIESKINQVRNLLPVTVNITTEKMNPSILPVMGYSLESHTKSPIELKLLALYTIKPFLSQVSGIAEVRIIGGKTKEYWLELNPEKMSSLGITPDLLTAALAQTNFISSNGYLTDYKRLYLSLTNTALQGKEDLERLVIFNNGKRITQIKDVARVEVKEGIEYVKINANGKDAILVAIIKQPNENLVDLSRRMEQKVSDLRKLLPEDVQLKPYYNQSSFVEDSVKSVTDSLWIGLALAIFVAILFLHSFRASLTILLTIPVTLLLTLIVLFVNGFTLNIMTLGAIAAALGLIIDDAIVVVEQIYRTQEENPAEPVTALVPSAIGYLLPAMVASSLSTIVIFLPFILMSGVAGAYFKVLTDTIIITLICSFLVTWIGLPVIYEIIGFKKKRKEKKKAAEKVHSQTWVYYFIKRPWISFIFIAGLITAIVVIFPLLQTGFLPEMDEGSIVMDYSSPPGTSLAETDRMLRGIEKVILKVPDVAAYSRRTGTQMGFFITEPNKGDYLIQLKKTKKHPTEEVIATLRSRINAIEPALRVDFGQVISDMLGDLMTSVQPIEIKIFGNDQSTLNALATQVRGLVDKVKGTADSFDGIVAAGPSIEVRPDELKLAQFGITPTSFQLQMQAQLVGTVAGSILEKEQLSTIRMIYPNVQKTSLDQVAKTKIFLPGGRLKPITELSTIEVLPGASELQREDLQGMGVVTARLDQRDLGSVMKDIQNAISKNIRLPSGYHIAYGGEFSEQTKSFNELLTILITASMLVFGVILFLSKDVLLSISVLFIGVLGAAGSFIALFVTGTQLNVGSYTGIVMIIGIIGENAIFTYWQYHTTAQEKSVDEAVVYAISTRLRPKLMTALGAIIALMPLALGIGVGAQLHQPLAIAVIGGFLVALPLLLIVFPSLLRLIYHARKTHTQ